MTVEAWQFQLSLYNSTGPINSRILYSVSYMFQWTKLISFSLKKAIAHELLAALKPHVGTHAECKQLERPDSKDTIRSSDCFVSISLLMYPKCYSKNTEVWSLGNIGATLWENMFRMCVMLPEYILVLLFFFCHIKQHGKVHVFSIYLTYPLINSSSSSHILSCTTSSAWPRKLGSNDSSPSRLDNVITRVAENTNAWWMVW